MRRLGLPRDRLRMQASAVAASMAILVAALAGCATGTGHDPGARSAARACLARAASGGNPPFSPSSVWNAPVPSNAPLDRSSSRLVGQLGVELQRETAGHVGPWINIWQYSVPIYRVSACEPTVPVHLDHRQAPALQQAFSAVPIPPGAQPAGGTDQEMVVYQPSKDRMWEFWEMHRQADGWHASWGGAIDGVSANPGYFHGPGPTRSWGASASGLSVMGGLITPEDVRGGTIDHALAITLPDVRAGQFALPAERTDGKDAAPNGIPEGAHLRLDPSLDLSTLHLSPLALQIARAAQRYGIIVRDYSANVAFVAEDPRGIGSNPWPQLIGNAMPSTLLAGFPWNRLQLLRMDLASG